MEMVVLAVMLHFPFYRSNRVQLTPSRLPYVNMQNDIKFIIYSSMLYFFRNKQEYIYLNVFVCRSYGITSHNNISLINYFCHVHLHECHNIKSWLIDYKIAVISRHVLKLGNENNVLMEELYNKLLILICILKYDNFCPNFLE